MKVNSTVYKGIEFIEISTLPTDQRTSLLQTINPELLIKILVDGKLMPRCIQYKVYEEWYDREYRPLAKKESNAIPESRGNEVNANFQV
jgi:hypothetical protein